MSTNLAYGSLSVPRPGWKPHQITARIVHIGCGAFHRAHQALYCHRLLEMGCGDWGICEVNLMSRHGEKLVDHLRQQQFLYCVAEQGASDTRLTIVGAIHEALHPQLDGSNAIIEALAREQTAIVSLTITEKGYCTDAASGKLNLQHPLIIHDLAYPEQPQSAIGYIVQALQLRRQRGLTGFSVLSCDNVRENGHVASAAVLGLAQARDPQLAQWIAGHVSFPCTMVDRIVPAATVQSLESIASQLGVYDPCAIACEPFSQWVIEDNFVADRPQWDRAGAQFVDNVIPFELMKLRMLNGSHSFLAYLGALANYQTIADTIRDDMLREAVLNLMLSEQAPTLNMPQDTDLNAYAQQLIARFSNPALHHRVRQIACDGSQKLPQRLLDPLRQRLAAGEDCRHLLLGVAGWMRYVQGVDEQGNAWPVVDPLAEQYQAIYQQYHRPSERLQALLSINSIFGDDLPANPVFVRALTDIYQHLCASGVRATLATLIHDRQ